MDSPSLATTSVELPPKMGESLKTFRDAFATEIGGDLARRISLRELADVIVCAGKDTTVHDLLQICPYATERDEIFTFEESFQIYQGIPATEVDDLYEMFGLFLQSGTTKLDYKNIISLLQQQNASPEVIKWFKRYEHQSVDFENIIDEITNCKKRLRNLNAQIVDEESEEQEEAKRMREASEERRSNRQKTSIMLLGSSTESLSSMFSNRNSYKPSSSKVAPEGTEMMPPLGSAANSFRDPSGEFKVRLKGLVIQKSVQVTNCIAYPFALEKTRRFRLFLRINDNIDSSLSRFHNSLIGILASRGDSPPKICAITKKKENKAMSTEWLKLDPGQYTLCMKFCRPLKMIESDKRDQIIDPASLKLTKPFKVMLMNLFDMFDLDNDGLLSRREFEAYSLLSGSGPVSEQEWSKVRKSFELSQDRITMRTFIEMHQKEADTYGPQGKLEAMWKAVRELGHNRKFFMSTACPVSIEFVFAEEGGFSLQDFQVDQLSSEDGMETALSEYFWSQGMALPYRRELASLRQFKAEYFAVLIAGKTDESREYNLDLSTSYNVNIEGNDLKISQTVPANTIKVLTVAIAQADSWFLSMKTQQQ